MILISSKDKGNVMKDMLNLMTKEKNTNTN